MPHSWLTENLWASVLESERKQQYIASSWVALASNYAPNIELDSFKRSLMKIETQAFSIFFPYDSTETTKELSTADQDMIDTYKRWQTFLKRRDK